MIKQAIAKVARQEDLAEKEVEEAMEEIMTGTATPAQIGSFVTTLKTIFNLLGPLTNPAGATIKKSITNFSLVWEITILLA